MVATTIENPAIDQLFGLIESHGWVGMVTEYPCKPGEPALAFVGDVEADVVFEASADHALEALNRAYHKMRTAEIARAFTAQEPT